MIDFEKLIRPLPGARFRLLDTPVAAPSFCVVCRGGINDGRKYVDFGFDIDWYGAVYFCSPCLSEATGYLGWINPTQHEALVKEVDRLTDAVRKLKEENARLRSGLDSLDFLGIISRDNVVSIDEDDAEESREGDNEPIVAISDDTEDESGPVKSSDGEGPADVLHDVEDIRGSAEFELNFDN